MARINRWYVRCVGCLSIAVVTEIPADSDVCGLCQSKVESMGRVHSTSFQALLVDHTTEIPACDGRCTGATGPRCDCPCGAVNHGTGAVVVIEHLTGAPRVVKMPDTAAARARAQQWAEAVEGFKALAPGRVEYQQLGTRRLSDMDYLRAMQHQDALRALGRARKLRTHKGRMHALAAYLAGKGLGAKAGA